MIYYIAIYYLLFGFISFFLYAKDKHASRTNSWRVTENTLHLISILGGWSGALLAQKYLRHKTKKKEFQIIFKLTIFLNLSILFALIYFIM
jgi:uncharacterized membrane protein YsdA (DUF1294 family)